MTDVELAAFLDRRLSIPDRERIAAHLAACPECRADVRETQAVLARVRRPRRIAFAAGSLAAAALLVVFVLPTRRSDGPVGAPDLVRAPDAPPALVAIGPSSEARAADLRFTWGRATDALTYRLTLSGEQGIPLWSASTADTSLALPDSVRLTPGARYYWIADALLRDGTSRSTGLRQFQVAR
jgi:hypothetical protein